MKHLKKLFVLTMAVALVVVIVPGLLAVEVEKISEEVAEISEEVAEISEEVAEISEEVAEISEEVAKININKASVDELLELKFVGPKFAERIVQYRTEHGPFETAEDIMKVKGIGPKVWDANKDRLTVE